MDMQMKHTNREKLDQYLRAPNQGPRILFFSGGTALRDTSKALIRYTRNSIHLITPFDSGGSSAVIRHAFDMPAVGDIRNRLMSLADQSMPGVPEIFRLFVHRLPKNGTHDELRQELESMAEGEHPLVRSIPDPMRTIILVDFHRFLNAMPRDFDLRGASIGNLVLTAEYLSNRRQMDSAISIFSKLARVCGVVLPTVDTNLHLAARLEDDRIVVGQHLLTGKESGPLTSPIRDLWLTVSLNDTGRVEAPVGPATGKRIAQADLICYPPGSFYSSIVANLLPQGVGRAVADNPCPKVFVPNTTHDPEVLDLSVADQARVLCRTLRQGGAPGDLNGLDAVIIDSEKGIYPNGIDRAAIGRMGLEIMDCPLVTEKSAPLIDAARLTETLLSLT